MDTMTNKQSTAPVVENLPTMKFLAPHRGEDRALAADTDAYRRFRSWFTRPLLTRPALLDAEQTRQLDHDLPLLLSTLQALPDRLFDGDQQEFARALGWTQPSALDALDLLSGPAVPLGRADLVRVASEFKVVEFNTSSSLGSFEFGELCRAVLDDPSFSEFAGIEGLYYVDPMEQLVDTILDLTGLSLDDHPTVALVDWVRAPFKVNASLFIDLMVERGIKVVTCTVADLEMTGRGLYAHGDRIDVVYRTFLLATVADDPAAARLLRPLAEAMRTGAAAVFTPLNADLFGTKECMALLSDGRNRDHFTTEEWEAAQRLLPWTRSMRNADVTPMESGSLTEHVLECREELVLKPSMGQAGRGVVAGWMVSPEQWDDEVRVAVAGNYVVQRRAHSAAERFFAGRVSGEPSTCLLHWGMFVTGNGLSGGFVKGLPDKTQDIRFLGDGSHVGCVFHTRA